MGKRCGRSMAMFSHGMAFPCVDSHSQPFLIRQLNYTRPGLPKLNPQLLEDWKNEVKEKGHINCPNNVSVLFLVKNACLNSRDSPPVTFFLAGD